MQAKQTEVPALLAGPILRRVEQAQVNIWVSTSEDYSIKASLFYIQKNSGENDFTYLPIATQQEVKTIQLGERLYIQLIQISPEKDVFLPNQLIGYQLSFKKGSHLFDLRDLGLLTKGHAQSIVYGNIQYPTFYIPSSQQTSPILYGSCRKPHGEGKDTLSLGDHALKESYDQIEKRPGSLFLMGDQIYADDVADPLIRAISILVKKLIGYREQLTFLESRLNHANFRTALEQINGRGYILQHFCRFTSSSANNHLIELGEYAMMYLLSWSPALWEFMLQNRLIDSFDEAVAKNDVYFVFSNDYKKEHKAEKNHRSKQYRKQLQSLNSFKRTLYSVRRLLANTSVYMIFDDHDITDDWNLSYEWRENVKGSPLGKHIITNGLTAYWAFQGWGNNPSLFDKPFIKTIKKYLTALKNTNTEKEYDAWTEQMWGFKQWHFVTATSPKAIFLDTRTQRQYDHCPKRLKIGNFIEETESIPQLISDYGWKAATRTLIESGWKGGCPLIIVSATPVYGMGLIENFMHKYTKPLRLLGVNVNSTFDFESWKYNAKGFTAFLQQVIDWNPEPCVILSGDVHYGSSVYAKVHFHNGQKLHIKQFTSSPQNNMSFTSLWGNLLKIAVWLKSKLREKRDLYRYCDEHYRIQYTKSTEVNNVNYIWKDQLRYQPIQRKSIVETDNNIGCISVSNSTIEHKLLTIKSRGE